MSDTAVIAPVYRALAAKTFETLARTLTGLHRNDAKNPTLSTELRRACTTALAEHGVTGDQHVTAVTDIAAATMMKTLPDQHVEINEIPNIERTRDAFTRARRDYIIDLFGGAPLPLLAAWMTQFAADPSLSSP